MKTSDFTLKFFFRAAALAGTSLLVSCASPYYDPVGVRTQQGAAIGALSGAGLGAIVGHNAHGLSRGEGAVGGALLGGVLGGVLGNQHGRTERLERDAYGYPPHRYGAPAPYGPQPYYQGPPPRRYGYGYGYGY